MVRLLSGAMLCVACGARSELGAISRGDAGLDASKRHDAGQDAGPQCPAATVPTVLADFSEGSALELAQDDVYIYWTTGISGADAVMRVPKCGGPKQIIFAQAIAPMGVAVDAQNVYVGGASINGSLYAIPKDGGAASTIATMGPGNRFLILDGSTLYASTMQGLFRVPVAGGSATLFASGSFQGTAVDGTNVYALEGLYGAGSVLSLPKTSDAGTALAPTDDYQGGIAVDGATVFYSGWYSPSDGYVRSVTNGSITSLAEGLAAPTGLAVDALNVFYAEEGNGGNGSGTVSSIPKQGGAINLLAYSQDRPEALVADAKSIYWLNFGGQIMKLDKP